MKDICAVSTPLAEGGISVIRISGENAMSIGAKVFKPLSCKSVENMAGSQGLRQKVCLTRYLAA